MYTQQHPLNALVLAVGGNVSQGILKALARCAIPTRVVGTDISELQFGLYTVDRGYIAPHAADEAFLDWLISLCRKESINVILSGCEPVLRVLAPAREQIERATEALCLVCPPVVWTTCDDKLLTCTWLRENGFECPDSVAAEDTAGMQRLVERHGFPLIAKPRMGGGAHGLLLVQNQDDLQYAVRKKWYMVQEFLGPDDQEYTAGCFCDREGAVRGSIVLWRELLAGTTYRAVAGDFPEVKQAAEKISGALHTSGPCNIQMRMTGRGPVCFEINPRFSGTTPIRAAFGFNEVEAALRHFLLGEPPNPLPDVTSGVALRYWNEAYISPDDCRRMRQEGVGNTEPGKSARIETYGMDGCASS